MFIIAESLCFYLCNIEKEAYYGTFSGVAWKKYLANAVSAVISNLSYFLYTIRGNVDWITAADEMPFLLWSIVS